LVKHSAIQSNNYYSIPSIIYFPFKFKKLFNRITRR